jgi:hypothetical protein
MRRRRPAKHISNRADWPADHPRLTHLFRDNCETSYIVAATLGILSIKRFLMPPARQSKRKRTECGSRSCQSKRPKLDHQSRNFHYPPQFFDNLSKVSLTKEALRELNRRNNLLCPQPSSVQNRRPVTRGYLATKRTRNKSNTVTTLELLHRTKKQEGLKLFARHGGPDLQDLTGVCS